MLEIHTVGAGGGSLARFDAGGSLRVGPESAGADPGPICYGRGTLPTVTDANLLMGRLRPERFLGGEFQLDLERAQRVTSEWLRAQGSRLSVEQFSAGIVRVVNANMERALRVVSIERGTIRESCAGGVWRSGRAACLRTRRGVGDSDSDDSGAAGGAFGVWILVSDVVKDYSRTVLRRLEGVGSQAEARVKLEKEFASWKRRRGRNSARKGGTAGWNMNAASTCAIAGRATSSMCPPRRTSRLACLLLSFMTNINVAMGITTRGGRLNWLRCVCGLVCGRRNRIGPERKVAGQTIARKASSCAKPVERAAVFFHDKAVNTPVFERSNWFWAAG